MEDHGASLAIALEHESVGMLREPGVDTRRVREKDLDGEQGGLEWWHSAVAGAAGDRFHPDGFGTPGAGATSTRYALRASPRVRIDLPGREQCHHECPRPTEQGEQEPAHASAPVARSQEGGDHPAEPPDADHSHATRAPIALAPLPPSPDCLEEETAMVPVVR